MHKPSQSSTLQTSQMEENNTTKSSSTDEIQPAGEEAPEQPLPQPGEDSRAGDGAGAGAGGWGWDFLSDLQKAAEEISRNAAEAAKTAANSINGLQNEAEVDNPEAFDKDGESEDEDEQRRKAAMEKLDNASDDTLFGQRLKVLDDSVENFASGAWQALGNAMKEGSSFIHRLENSIQERGSVAPSLLETGKAFSAKGMQVLEYVGKEMMDLLISETGIKLDKNAKGGNEAEDDEMLEEVTFERCFYIYGGPEQLEELEALSNHYTLLFNRRKAKLSSEQRSEYDVKLKQVQQIFSFDTQSDGNNAESEKGKKVENLSDSTDDEIKSFHGSSVSKAAEMAAGFANALAGLSPSDIVKRTGGRLDSLHSEGIHRLSEMCCIAVSQLLILGKSVISNTSKSRVADVDIMKIEWPDDCVEKAKIIKMKAQSMTGYLEGVSISFLTGISDVAEAYVGAIKGANEVSLSKLIKEKVDSFSDNLRVNQTTSVGKIQEGLRYLAYLVVSASMPAA